MEEAYLWGLTPFGAQVIRECNRLAHGTDATVTDALKAATQPLIISHTGLSKTDPSADLQRRLITKELPRHVVDADSIIGIWRRLIVTTAEYVAAIRTRKIGGSNFCGVFA